MKTESGKAGKRESETHGSPPRQPTFSLSRPPAFQNAAFQINIRKQKELSPSDFLRWWQRECRTGGELAEYLRIEKARTTERYRRVARKEQNFRQNNKSEFRRLADIPLRDYFRWLREDPDFWRDDKNLKSLRRDNSDATIYV